jgi:hypothetical protein
MRVLLYILVFLFFLMVALSSAPAFTLPGSCDQLIEGECDNPITCLYFCFLELAGLRDFCDQYPGDPRCM